MKKSAIIVLVINLLAMMIFPATAFARPIPVAAIGDANFNTLIEAVQVANQYPGSTIELLSDATYNTTMLSFGDLTVNMNGYSIYRLDTAARWFVGGIEEPEDIGGTAPDTLPVVVINGGENGSTIADAEDADGDISTPLITVQYANITINNVTMLNRMFNDDASAFCVRDGAVATLNNCDLTSCCGIKIFREVGTAPSTLNVNGGSVTGMCTADSPWQGSAIMAESSCLYPVNINLDGVRVTSENTAALLMSPYCNAVVKDSALTGATAVYFKSGSLTIENSTVESTGVFMEAPTTGPDINTAFTPVFDGSGIQIDSDNKYGDPLPVALSGTTVVSANGYGIREIGGKDGASLVELDLGDAQVSGAMGDVSLLN